MMRWIPSEALMPRVSVPWKIWRRSRYIRRPSFRRDQQGYKGESLLDYIKEFRSLVFLDESNRLLERGETVEKEYRQSFENRMEKGQIAERSDGRDLLPVTVILASSLNQMRGAALSDAGGY